MTTDWDWEFCTRNTVAAAVLFLSFLFYKYWKTYSFWSSRGIKGPTPLPFFGNTLPFFFKSYAEVDIERFKKYGRLYGTYDGSQPVLMVSDLDLVKKIYVTEFSTFMDHIEISGDPVDMNSLIALSGEHWKRVRTVVTTAFTTSKMKEISEVAKPCKQNLLNLLDELAKQGQNLHIIDVFSLYVLDIMAKSFFSLDVDVYKDPKGQLIRAAQDSFPFTAGDIFLASNLPGWLHKLLGLSNIGSSQSHNYLVKLIEFAIEKRKSSGERKRDLLQTFVDARETNMATPEKGLTEIELLANGVFLIGAGFDTSTTAMCFMTWLLALNQNAQEKVYREVVQLVGDDLSREVTYDDLSKLTYLEAAITESLRMYAADARGFRRPVRDTTIPGTDIPLPKGTVVNVPFHALHYDPEYYPEPEKFRPERFLAENNEMTHSNAFMSFGDGPRKCPGLRLAYQNIKQAFAELIRRYKFVPCPETITKLRQPAGKFIIYPNELIIGIEKRN